jgi:hypothetical protein
MGRWHTNKPGSTTKQGVIFRAVAIDDKGNGSRGVRLELDSLGHLVSIKEDCDSVYEDLLVDVYCTQDTVPNEDPPTLVSGGGTPEYKLNDPAPNTQGFRFMVPALKVPGCNSGSVIIEVDSIGHKVAFREGEIPAPKLNMLDNVYCEGHKLFRSYTVRQFIPGTIFCGLWSEQYSCCQDGTKVVNVFQRVIFPPGTQKCVERFSNYQCCPK